MLRFINLLRCFLTRSLMETRRPAISKDNASHISILQDTQPKMCVTVFKVVVLRLKSSLIFPPKRFSLARTVLEPSAPRGPR